MIHKLTVYSEAGTLDVANIIEKASATLICITPDVFYASSARHILWYRASSDIQMKILNAVSRRKFKVEE